jgi:RNA polymerase sigma-70 factor (ECF subfamily)
MLATAIRVLGSSREAQDLLHDVFLEAWEHAREYDPARGTVRAWLFVRLRSRALDRMGRASRTRERSIADHELSEELDILGVASNTDDHLAMKQALSTLSPDVRQALDWTYFEGLTAREIADRAGVPVGTVRSRLARGIAALGAVFEPDGGRDGD